MNAPCGLSGAIQFAVLKAGTALTTNSTITTSFTATRKLLKRAVSRTPATRIAVIRIITAAAGRFSTAPVNVQACFAASKANGDETNWAGRSSPKSFAKLTTYPDISGPADGDRGGPYGVFEAQAPPDSPGAQV